MRYVLVPFSQHSFPSLKDKESGILATKLIPSWQFNNNHYAFLTTANLDMLAELYFKICVVNRV